MTDDNRKNLPDWPRLMPIAMAAAYYSMSENTFRLLGIVPIERGRKVLYDRRSLDIFADRMGGQPIDGVDAERAAVDQERAFLARRRNGRS
ncbi:hypothetical protein [Sphingomonas sanguinis]|jgi:hypothetical protein|uniref:DNA-binding protein n=1 Tax=Sphingomonas sanguinis TaxID=33051 RepID=A0A7Y7QVP3_9SPHN|nr:hypothetical protein [Sphingomonas sanguinis]MBZ6382252.1 hypothetical protein [Sphingomonas sanguinis]NNG50838.1 DNA-binding protein [Sphingomonas sanguinis]NNG54374.1 DNA-binding protein [Sphingomonas sanguinis]NVP31550.1 DNA-binding protein [Sphingomonas sanguinis]